MKVKINGQLEEFSGEKVNLLQYLQQKDIRPEIVAVEVNLHVINKQRYGDVYMAEGDEVEIVKFVGGGA